MLRRRLRELAQSRRRFGYGRLSFSHSMPNKVITVDNGTEFFSQAMDTWAYRHGIQLEFIRPGRL